MSSRRGKLSTSSSPGNNQTHFFAIVHVVADSNPAENARKSQFRLTKEKKPPLPRD